MQGFDQILLRLKQELSLRTDKSVAAALGLTPTAFNDRKKRDSFPVDKLRALQATKPDLDVDYVLTGHRIAEDAARLVRGVRGVVSVHEYTQRLWEETEKVLAEGSPSDYQARESMKALMEDIASLDEEGMQAIQTMVSALKNKK